MLPILTVPSPILRQQSKPITRIHKKVLNFIDQLEQTLVRKDHPKGIGLSAIQVGKPWRIFITYLPQTNGHKPTAKIYINPQIIAKSKKLTLYKQQKPTADQQQPFLEGCLSIPKIYGPVYRHQWLKLSWKTPENQFQTAKFANFEARVIQHELDHLNGILFTDRNLRQKLPIYQQGGGKLTPIQLSSDQLTRISLP